MVGDVEKDDLRETAEEGEAGAGRQPEAMAGGPGQEAEAPAGPAAEAAEASARDLEAELAQAKAQANDYLDQWRRTAADFANYRKRIEREREEADRSANSLFLTRLLVVLDDLERAMATLPADLLRLSWVEGVPLIYRKLEYILEQEGLKRIEAQGKPFDPQRHEAVLREETTAQPDGQVMAELQRGYEYRGRVLRPALVKVAVTPPPAPPPAAAEQAADGSAPEATPEG